MNTLSNMDEIEKMISSNKIALLYISSENCNVCTVIFPRLLDMLLTYPEIESAKVDILKLPLISGTYNVFTIPCVLIFAEGKEIFRQARYIDIDYINQQIDRNYDFFYR